VSKFQRLFLLFAVIATSAFFSISTSHAVEYAIGDTGPAGGKIFITPSTAGNTTGKYFEVTTEVFSSSAGWCNGLNQSIPNTTSLTIGAGQGNSEAMVNFGCSTGAAGIANNYTLNSYSDWYLPSGEEASQVFISSGATGIFAVKPFFYFWTSSIFSDTRARVAMSAVSDLTHAGQSYALISVIPIRSFVAEKSAAEVAAELAAADEAARKAAEEARAARIIAAKATLTSSLESKSEFTTQMMLEADAGVTRISSIQAIFAELKAIQAVNKGSLSDSEQKALRIKVGFKYQTLEKITGDNPVNIYARTLVSTGLLGASTPQKSRIFSLIKALPTQSRDSMEKINIFVAQEVALVQARRERLAARLAK
jgi:hypothetical protein